MAVIVALDAWKAVKYQVNDNIWCFKSNHFDWICYYYLEVWTETEWVNTLERVNTSERVNTWTLIFRKPMHY